VPKLIIDSREVEVESGATLVDAAKVLGVDIPTMCFLKEYKPSTSCMVCVVRVAGKTSLVPACGTIAEDGMRVETDTKEVTEARTAALELLLSDHVGDCMGPCHVTCPAKMDIPLMIRQIAKGHLRKAIATIKKDIALPAVLGRICPAPCEKSCRRGAFDEAVSICLLKRCAADADLASAEPYLPDCKAANGKRVAIAGAGPAGLSGAYYLLQKGYNCTIFDEHDQMGGMLRRSIDEEKLPRSVLDQEVGLILKLGAKFQGQTRIDTDVSVEDLRRDFDAIFLAPGVIQSNDRAWSLLEKGPNGITINRSTYETSVEGVFAGGDCLGQRKLAVRAVAHGKEAAVAIDQYLSGEAVTGPAKVFNSRIGKMKDGEIVGFMGGVSESARVEVSEKHEGYDDPQAVAEAARCLHCDCRKPDDCKLREYACEYEAKSSRYKNERRAFVQQVQHPDVIYEPGKCIKCGLCIQIASEAKEELGLTFIGRGFNVQMAVPFGRSIAEGLKVAAKRCVGGCPTGALALKDSA
jgi:NADPH-dependent glutamate synthase beta subunit-like oxidoreductase